MLEHGGRLRDAARRYGIALEDWIDLSTALNPYGYVPPPIPPEAWHRLPEEADGLEAAAAAYYGNARLLPVPGSQAAIQALPRLFDTQCVAVLEPSYNEHAHAWRNAKHEVIAFAAEQLEQTAERCDTLVLCNPNNPDAKRIAPERLLALTQAGKRLVIDEAFVDATPAQSLTAFAGGEAGTQLIVLRSMGKFFGLAGARVGFAFASPPLLAALAEAIGPWAVSGPARVATTAALRDTDWQTRTRHRLAEDGARLAQLLAPLGDVRGTALFAYIACRNAVAAAEFFARRGIFVRQFDSALRFGLPDDEAAWQRLADAIHEWGTIKHYR